MSDINRIRKLAGLPELKQEQLNEGYGSITCPHCGYGTYADQTCSNSDCEEYGRKVGHVDDEGNERSMDDYRMYGESQVNEGFDWLDADPEFISWALDKGFSDEDYQELKDVIASDYDEAGQPQSFAQHNPDMMAQILQTYFSHLYPNLKRRYDAAFGESVNEAPEDYPNVVATKPGDGDYEKGFMYWDTETGELYKTHPGYERLSYDDFVKGRGEVQSGGDFAHMSDEELQAAIDDAMEQGDQGAAEEYYAELEKRSMGESAEEYDIGRDRKASRDAGEEIESEQDWPESDEERAEREAIKARRMKRESVEATEEELTEAPTMDTTQLITLMKNAGMNEEAISKKLDEWANTPEGVGEVEPTSHGDTYEYAQAVNLSLKKYLDAEDMKVGIKEHTAVNMKALWEQAKANRIDEVGVNDIDDDECDNCGSKLHNGECPQCDADDVNESAETEEEDVIDEAEEVEESEEEQIDEQAAMIARIRKLSGL